MLITGITFSNGCRAAAAHERYLIEAAAAARAMLVIGEQWYIGEQCGMNPMDRDDLSRGVKFTEDAEWKDFWRDYKHLMPGGLLDTDDTDGTGTPDVVEQFENLRVVRNVGQPPLLQITFRYDAARFPAMSLENFGERVALQGILRPEPITIWNCGTHPPRAYYDMELRHDPRRDLHATKHRANPALGVAAATRYRQPKKPRAPRLESSQQRGRHRQ